MNKLHLGATPGAARKLRKGPGTIWGPALLDGLSGQADTDQNNDVTINELKSYVDREVWERSGRKQRPTTPKVFVGEDFPISRVPER